MRTEHHYIIDYAATDTSRRLRLFDLERYLLQAAGESAEQMGISTDYLLEEYGSAWVLTRLSVEMNCLPQYNEELIIESWIEANVHMLSIRNFRIFTMREGERVELGRCASVWTALNLTSRQVDARIFSDPIMADVVDGEKLGMPSAPRLGRIAEPTLLDSYTVRYSDLDYNLHFNSCQYLRLFLDTDDSLTGHFPIRFDINYAKEVHKGDCCQVQVLREETEGNQIQSIRYCLLTPAGEVSSTACLQVK